MVVYARQVIMNQRHYVNHLHCTSSWHSQLLRPSHKFTSSNSQNRKNSLPSYWKRTPHGFMYFLRISKWYSLIHASFTAIVLEFMYFLKSNLKMVFLCLGRLSNCIFVIEVLDDDIGCMRDDKYFFKLSLRTRCSPLEATDGLQTL